MQRNRDYQRELAESLIVSLGMDGAYEFASQNLWDGVLAHISLRQAKLDADGAQPQRGGGSRGHRPH